MPHPRAGKDAKKSAFPLGCSICRSDHLIEYDQAQAAIAEMMEGEKQDFFQIDRTLHASSTQVSKKGKGGKGKGKGKAPPAKKKKKSQMFRAVPLPAFYAERRHLKEEGAAAGNDEK